MNDKIYGGDQGFGWSGHGVHVSGIAAAESNNTQGISGVDWHARLHPQRVDNVDDVGTYQAIIDAVNFSPNVHVLNNSWGLTDIAGNYGRYSTIVRQAFAYAYKANRTCVASIGNNQVTQPGVVGFPAGFDNIIAVGATNNADVIANFSAQGNHIDVCAPGVGILSTLNGAYGSMSGTSMAAPHVSGIASLLKGFKPQLANDDIENIIKLSADDVNGNGYDQVYGFGRVNAERALSYVTNPYALVQNTVSSGTIISTSNQFVTQFISATGLPTGNYLVKRIEIQKTISLPGNLYNILGVWGRGAFSTGWSIASPNFGEGYCEVVPGSLTSTNVTLRSYVYQVWNIGGSYLGYFPASPSDATFAYSVLGSEKPSISGSSQICNQATYTINNFPSNATVQWSISPYYVATLQNNGETVTVSKLNDGGICVLTANITINNQQIILTKNIEIGVPVINSVEFINSVGGNGYWCSTHTGNTFSVNTDFSNISNYEARLLSWPNLNLIRTNSNASPSIDPFGYVPNGFYVFQLQATNTCGVSQRFETEIEYVDCLEYSFYNESFDFLVTPNPATNYITVSIVEKKSVNINSENNVKCQIISMSDNSMIKSWSFSDSEKNSVDISNLRKGSYIIKVNKGEHNKSKLLFIR